MRTGWVMAIVAILLLSGQSSEGLSLATPSQCAGVNIYIDSSDMLQQDASDKVYYCLNELVETAHFNTTLWVAIANAYHALGLFGSAVTTAKEVIEFEESMDSSKIHKALSWEAYEIIGRCRYGQNKYPDAITAFLEARSRCPLCPGVLKGLARTRHQLLEDEQAVEVLTALIDDREDAEAYYLLGISLQALGQIQLAEEAYLHALKLTPRKTVYIKSAVELCNERLQNVTGYAVFMDDQPRVDDHYQNAGRVYRTRSKYDEAIHHFLVAADFASNVATRTQCLSTVASIHNEIRNFTGTVYYYRLALSKSPKDRGLYYSTIDACKLVRNITCVHELYLALGDLFPHENNSLTLQYVNTLVEMQLNPAAAAVLKELHSHVLATDYAVTMAIAEKYQSMGLFADCGRVYMSVLEVPDAPEAFWMQSVLGQAECMRFLGSYDMLSLAGDILETFVHEKGLAVDEHYWRILGENRYARRQYLQGINAFEEVLKIRPADVGAHLRIGDGYFELKMLGALEFYQRAVDLWPRSAEAIRKLSRAYEQNGRLEFALALLEDFYATYHDDAVLADMNRMKVLVTHGGKPPGGEEAHSRPDAPASAMPGLADATPIDATTATPPATEDEVIDLEGLVEGAVSLELLKALGFTDESINPDAQTVGQAGVSLAQLLGGNGVTGMKALRIKLVDSDEDDEDADIVGDSLSGVRGSGDGTITIEIETLDGGVGSLEEQLEKIVAEVIGGKHKPGDSALGDGEDVETVAEGDVETVPTADVDDVSDNKESKD